MASSRAVKVEQLQARSILTAQRGGFLTSAPHPFTHTCSPYTGCSLGNTLCGRYCYAQHLPNWAARLGRDTAWGAGVQVKQNAATVLEATLAGMRAYQRRKLRIFMASTTDPYQPLEARYRLTRQCLTVFARYTDLDLLVLQTRSTLAKDDFALLRAIPYVWLSVTIESDDEPLMRALKAWPAPRDRLDLVREAAALGIPTQITVSPCLPYTPAFAATLAASGARRIVVDTFVQGDGSQGARTAQSPYVETVRGADWRDTALADWRATGHAERLFTDLRDRGMAVGWSAAGFCGIPDRE